ncbi:hypothetical protein HGRIS_007658 [Hohenbuehelia grisea]|uniref:Uncharacterized protein n=1 Tax=Hohenbuehelia grisea TaxID=104357 RepID=A0ABR3J5G9_9AGAR
MLFDPSTASHLKPWLIRALEPICDAEPGALADYILALLKHNAAENEMRQELTLQLDEFLEKECSNFMDTLFTVLRTKSYLPYASAPSTSTATEDTGIPIPLDGLISPSMASSPERPRKRNHEGDEADGRPPKGPRLSNDGQFSRHPNGRNAGRDGRPIASWNGPHGGGMEGTGGMGYANGRGQPYRPPDMKRGICRDYHNNGFCARGAMCKFSHGEDAVVPNFFPMNGQAMPGPGMPFMPMFPGGNMPYDMGGAGAYDPHQARMDMRGPMNGSARPQPRAPLLPRMQQEDGRVVHPINATGELPVIQDLTPAVPPSDADSQPQAGPSGSNTPHPTPQNMPPQMPLNPAMDGSGYAMNGAANSMQGPPNDFMHADGPRNHGHGGHHGRQRGGGSRPRGRGTFGGDVHDFGSGSSGTGRKGDNKTLVVEKIPADKLTLDQVNGWFKRFGTVTNVAIDPSGGKALVSFSSPEEAHTAWKAEDAVFNNRFVKVFWHRPMEGHGKLGTRMLEASAPVVATIANKDVTMSEATPPPSSTPTPAPPKKSSTVSALAAKQQLLEQQIAEQKSLMASLATASPEEKKTVMARLRKLGEEMSAKSSSSPGTPAPPAGGKTPPPAETDQERKERERLDKELESLNATEGDGDSSEDLKAKLERLKAEAASLGIAESGHPPAQYGGYRPYRGRARGARSSFYRGAMRGGPPRASMKLDNRPKKLLVKGVDAEGTQALRDWYETTGQLDVLETLDSGDVVVSFKTRAAAEQGLAKGSQVPTIGAVQVSWHTPGATVATKTGPTSSTEDSKPEEREPSPLPERLGSPHLVDEEVIASGWGGDGDGEDGMGML